MRTMVFRSIHAKPVLRVQTLAHNWSITTPTSIFVVHSLSAGHKQKLHTPSSKLYSLLKQKKQQTKTSLLSKITRLPRTSVTTLAVSITSIKKWYSHMSMREK